MKKKLFKVTLIVLFVLGFFSWWYWPKQPKPVIKPVINIKQRSFTELPGWQTGSRVKSLAAFQVSCKTFLRQNPEQEVGTQQIRLQVKDWQPACRAALVQPLSESAAKNFFQQWFTPIEFNDSKPVNGLFTGYYMASLHGSRHKSKDYPVPIYGLPSNLISVNLEQLNSKLKNLRIVGRLQGNRLVPYPTRKEINEGAIAGKAPVLAWVDSSVDRLFLEIQGSGTVEMEDGSRVFLNYAGENGAPYTSVAAVLIKLGVMTKHNASMQRIKKYLEENPEQMDTVLNSNKSFVFFHYQKTDTALGAQGVALTPGYSMAIDRKWIPLGAPLWLNTTRPSLKNTDNDQAFQRLMIAQDTGGAIKGIVRGDVYWGAGDRATSIAGRMKNPGHYWLLLPKHTIPRLQERLT